MISIQKTYWLPSIRKEWIILEKKANTTPFQQYSFCYNLWLNFFPYYYTKGIPVFYVIRDNEKVVLIAPMCKGKKGVHFFLGDVNGGEYCDFLYEKGINNVSYFCYFAEYMTKNRYTLFGKMIVESSVLYEFFKSQNSFKLIQNVPYVNIAFSDTYLSYYKSLSSSMRQNIRTAYNRLARDSQLEFKILYSNKTLFTLQFAIGDSINFENRNYIKSLLSNKDVDNYFASMLDIYIQRHKLKYNVKTIILKKYFLKHLSFSTINLKSLPNAVSFMLLINGELAAFMSGYENMNNNSFIVPRLSINDKYNFYSPGVLLLNECVFFYTTMTKIRNIDLGKGDEVYKKKMGGVNINTVDFKVF